MFNSQRTNPKLIGATRGRPNEILVAFREDTYAKGTVGEAGCVLEYWEPYLGVLRHQGFEVTGISEEHAQKVLTRLVNVYGGLEE